MIVIARVFCATNPSVSALARMAMSATTLQEILNLSLVTQGRAACQIGFPSAFNLLELFLFDASPDRLHVVAKLARQRRVNFRRSKRSSSFNLDHNLRHRPGLVLGRADQTQGAGASDLVGH